MPFFLGQELRIADHLQEALTSSSSRLLVLPYGSVFPEGSWFAIKHFLDAGGDLLVLGGRPFTRAAYKDSQGWHLRDYSVRFIRPLMIDQYQETPGSGGLEFAEFRLAPATLGIQMEASLQPCDPLKRSRPLSPRRSCGFN